MELTEYINLLKKYQHLQDKYINAIQTIIDLKIELNNYKNIPIITAVQEKDTYENILKQ